MWLSKQKSQHTRHQLSFWNKKIAIRSNKEVRRSLQFVIQIEHVTVCLTFINSDNDLFCECLLTILSCLLCSLWVTFCVTTNLFVGYCGDSFHSCDCEMLNLVWQIELNLFIFNHKEAFLNCHSFLFLFNLC